MKKRLAKGFTLLEMMMVIAIIGIMATLAIPAYQDYAIKARVMEGLELAMPARMAVSEAYMLHHAFPDSAEHYAYDTPSATKNVSSIHIGANGLITISYTKQAGDGTLILSPNVKADGQLVWQCKEGTLAFKYRPQMCAKDV